MSPQFDAIVIGSGASAVHAAFPLVEGGRRVLMLDVGNEDLRCESLIPARPFEDIRRSAHDQHRWFLGDRLEGVAIGDVGAGPQITPPRAFVLQDSQRLGPKTASQFEPLESFALGGLGRAWGAVAFPFDDAELARCGLPAGAMREHYETVARRVGVSGCADDDLRALRGPLAALQPPLPLDHNAAAILARYARLRGAARPAGMHLGQAMLAALSQPLDGRDAHAGLDMDFWSNHGRSVYRPDITLDALRQRPNFVYRPRFLAATFVEAPDGSVRVDGSDVDRGDGESFTAAALLLAAGAIGTTRIVLRSFGQYDRRLPFVCNAHAYLPCLHLRGLGLAHAQRCHSLAQLTLIHDAAPDDGPPVQAQMYSYRSLQLFRLFRQTPLPHREGLRILRALAPHFVIWVIQHEDRPTPRKACLLRRGATPSEDVFEIEYADAADEVGQRRRAEANIARFVRRLGCLPLQRVHPPHGSSVHYAGPLPMTDDDRPLTTELSGRLRGTRAVYVADGAAFAVLPAKGPTLTLMANANRVGESVRERLAAPATASAR